MGRVTRGVGSGLALLLSTIGLIAAQPTRSAIAADAAHDRIVSANPVDWTPQVVDDPGSIRALAQTGNTFIAGGTFTRVTNAGSSTQLTRTNIFTFNATTGAVTTTFAPTLDGMVRSVLPSANGSVVYVGGEFKNVNGVAVKSLIALNLSTGQIDPTFKVPVLDGRVYSMSLANGKLYIAGNFKHVAGRNITYIAALNPITGAVDPAFTASITGLINPAAPSHSGWTTKVIKLDVSPTGNRMVFSGDFTTVNGQSRPQIAMLDITTPTPTLANWQTNLFSKMCHTNWENFVMDVAYAPDGTYFSVAAAGGYDGDTSTGCDSATRWDAAATGTGLAPSWIDFTGGDTLWSIASSGSAVYVGGHERWLNNPYGGDFGGAGSVPRNGLGALDPKSGVPHDWNPGRTLGVGVLDLLTTSAGLWIGHDTNTVAGETHKKIAFFPVTGGKVVPNPSAGTLPGDVLQLGNPGASTRSVGTCGSASTNADDAVSKRFFTGTSAGAQIPVTPQGVAWGQARGAFMLSGTLYTGFADGTLCRRSFNGTNFGSPTTVNLYSNVFGTEVKTVTGMFFTNNRIYYTKSGSSTLFYRGFNPQSDIVGAYAYGASGNVTGIDFSKIGGMYVANGKLYYVHRTDGILRRIDWNGFGPVPGTSVALSSTTNWAAQAVTLVA
jgi:hypothetical protein